MILILSDIQDTSTTHVIEWLEYLKKDYHRINTQDELEIDFCCENIVLKTAKRIVNLNEIKVFWYRRGYLSVRNKFDTKITQFENLKSEEFKKIIHYIYYKFNKIKHLNSFLNIDVNKLIVNAMARDLNILTPDDLLFSETLSLNKLLSNYNKQYITKVISGYCMQNFGRFTIYNYTKEINKKNIDNNLFFPSLVQNKINKKYELRIFYLDGCFYTMAIFSQGDKQTDIDFRNYNNEKPNRTVSFKLPKAIEVKLDLLMKKLELNSGSIDMIVTHENDYVFLEVNPVGQFGMVSYPCNYNLEKKIAEFLSYD